jgi:ACS family tartrate transporter-like MFS transporter
MTTNPAAGPSVIETTTIRKVRSRIVPFITVLMVIASLDKMNIGFAALTMNKELAISSQQYGFLAGIFYFGYFTFEIPSNLLLHRIGARVWLARILISWGIVAMATGFAKTAGHVYFLRFLLGVAEAGYFPGIVLYLTYWFRQRQFAQTIALFITANPVASILGAPVSGVILDHAHWFGMIQRGRRARLSAKPFESPRVPGQVVRKKFERDKRPREESSALYTTPMPPPPSFSMIL